MYELKIFTDTKWRYNVVKKVKIPQAVKEYIDLEQYFVFILWNNPFCWGISIIDKPSKANQTTLLVSRPPLFIILGGRAVIIHYSLCSIMAF